MFIYFFYLCISCIYIYVICIDDGIVYCVRFLEIMVLKRLIFIIFII